MSIKKSKKKEPKKEKPSAKSHNKRAENMTLDEWQISLRKQYAALMNFGLIRISEELIFADYSVHNPISNKSYKVAIRDNKYSTNFCNCMDFKTNLLGTCKHIEYTLLKILKSKAKIKLYQLGSNPPYSSIYLDYKKEHQIKIRIGTENSTAYKNLANKYFDSNLSLKLDSFMKFDILVREALKINGNFKCYDDAMEFVLNRRESITRNERIDHALKTDKKFISSLINTKLFPYQIKGIEFALRTGRCLIADEMGLGKTIQAITAAEGFLRHFNIRKILVIVPTSLKYQWSTEIKKFTNSKVNIVVGGIHNRKIQYTQDIAYTICSHHTAARDVDYINREGYDLVILDEAQRIKNWKAGISEKLKSIQSKYVIVLTGTPLENKIDELYSVMQMVNPFKLGALFRFLHQHEQYDADTRKVVGYKDLHQIKEVLSDVLIRRTKKDVNIQLPARMDKMLFVPMTPQQMEMHMDADYIVKRTVAKWISTGYLSEEDRLRLMSNLNLMRMSCDSTYLVDQKTRHDHKIDELVNILNDLWSTNENAKVVVFSEWERMTKIVSAELTKQNIHHQSLSGKVPGDKRSALIEDFMTNPDCRVFLSTDVGGTGLNLQNATTVINLDLPWNPAKLEQRIARVYRLGQKENVQVINMIATDTIEHKMLEKLHFKSSLFKGILDDGESIVMMKSSILKDLMGIVQDITVDSFEVNNTYDDEVMQGSQYNPVEEVLVEDDLSISTSKKGKGSPKNKTNEDVSQFEKDFLRDDEAIEPAALYEPKANDPNLLISDGLNFLGRLAETLSDASKTESLIKSITKTDEKGQTFLHIPIDNRVIENGLKLLMGLLMGNK